MGAKMHAGFHRNNCLFRRLHAHLAEQFLIMALHFAAHHHHTHARCYTDQRGRPKISGIALAHRPAQRKAPIGEFFNDSLHPQRHAIAFTTEIERNQRALPRRMTSRSGFRVIHRRQHGTLRILPDQFRE